MQSVIEDLPESMMNILLRSYIDTIGYLQILSRLIDLNDFLSDNFNYYLMCYLNSFAKTEFLKSYIVYLLCGYLPQEYYFDFDSRSLIYEEEKI